MKRCIIIIFSLICFLFSGYSVYATAPFTAQSLDDVTFGESLTATEEISLSENFDVTYKFDFSTSQPKIENAQLWLLLDLGDHNLKVALTGNREAQIIKGAGDIQPLDIVTQKEGLSEKENSIYRAGRGLVTDMSDKPGTQYRLTVQLRRYGNKILCHVYQPAFQLLSLSTQVIICDFLYIAPGDIEDNVSLSLSGETISLTDIELVNYPTLSDDPESSMWSDAELSDGSETNGWFKLLIFVIAFVVCGLLALGAFSLSITFGLDELNITFRRCLLLASSVVIAIAGLIYWINPYLLNYLTRKFDDLTMSGYGAPVADSCRWLIYIPAALCSIVVLIIYIATLMKAHKAGRSGAVFLGVFVVGVMYLPLAYMLWLVVFEILKVFAAIAVVGVICALLGTIDYTPQVSSATIKDEYGNSRDVRITEFGEGSGIYLTDSSGTKSLRPDGHGGYTDGSGNRYEFE